MTDCNEKSDRLLLFQSDLINSHQKSVSIPDVHSLHWRKGNQNPLRTRWEMYKTRSLNEFQIPQPVNWVTNESHLDFHAQMIKSFIVPLNHGRDRRWVDVKPCSPPSCRYILRSLWLWTLPACSQIKILLENREIRNIGNHPRITRESTEFWDATTALNRRVVMRSHRAVFVLFSGQKYHAIYGLGCLARTLGKGTIAADSFSAFLGEAFWSFWRHNSVVLPDWDYCTRYRVMGHFLKCVIYRHVSVSLLIVLVFRSSFSWFSFVDPIGQPP
jgi:hypothetical protein